MAEVEGRLYGCLEVAKQRYFCRRHSIHIHRTYSIQAGLERGTAIPDKLCFPGYHASSALCEVLVQRKLIWQIGKMQLVRVMVTKGKWREGRQDRNDSRPGLRESHRS